MFEYKIKDLKYRINGLVPKDVCNYFIDFFIKNQNKSLIIKEESYKFKSNAIEMDNFNSLNLSEISLIDDSFKEPLEIAKKYFPDKENELEIYKVRHHNSGYGLMHVFKTKEYNEYDNIIEWSYHTVT